jgi:glycosyltransferase involved in cell wall biosynthesis
LTVLGSCDTTLLRPHDPVPIPSALLIRFRPACPRRELGRRIGGRRGNALESFSDGGARVKILHLSTHDTRGGAARAAWRLQQAQRKLGAESRMLVRTKQRDSENVVGTDDGTLAAWHESIATPWLQKRLPAGASWFTSGCLDAFVENHPWVREADVLHLHWVAEWLSAEAIARLAATGKPVFWTLHDLWPVTGGNHYAGSNTPEGEAWQTGEAMPESLRGIARREFDRKYQFLRDLPLHVFSPSRWLAEVVRRTRIGGGWRIDVLPNGIPTESFAPGERAAARARWEVPAGKVMLLFGCQALGERRKGFSELAEALRLAARHPVFAKLAREATVELAIFGADKPALDDLPLPVRQLGVIADDRDLGLLYQAADAFLCPALEDNLPTTVIESLACESPVIGFATGGVPDLVRDGGNGLLAPCGDVTALADRIVGFVTNPALRGELRASARHPDPARFSVETQARRALEFYGAGPGPAAVSPVVHAAADAPPASFPCSLVNEESGWLVGAAAEAVSEAARRDEARRQKIAELKAKILRMKSKPAAPKPKPRNEAGWFRRWRRHRTD